MSTLEQLGFTFQPQRRIFSVRDLVGMVRIAVEREYTDIWIGGEISNYRPAESGHLYFTLKDGEAQLRVVMFRTQARLLRFRPDNGMEILARGRVTVYESRGELQLIAEYLEPKGAGALQIAFEQLKQKFAYIVVDAPPTLPIADSHILAGLSDKVLFVVRARKTPRELFQHAIEGFDAANLLGAVLNDVDYQRSRYAYAYEYYKKAA